MYMKSLVHRSHYSFGGTDNGGCNENNNTLFGVNTFCYLKDFMARHCITAL